MPELSQQARLSASPRAAQPQGYWGAYPESLGTECERRI